MAPDLVADFEARWPELSRRLRCVLGRKRIPAHQIDDIVQETGARLLRIWESVDRDRSTWPLTVTIALNLLRDEARARRWESLDPIAVPVRCDVEDAGIARAELTKVMQALRALPVEQRLAVLGPLMADAGADTAAGKMRRSRARRRLRALMEQASAIGLVRRSAIEDLLRLLGRLREPAVAAATGAIALVLGVPVAAPPPPARAGSLPPTARSAEAWTSAVATDSALLDSRLASRDAERLASDDASDAATTTGRRGQRSWRGGGSTGGGERGVPTPVSGLLPNGAPTIEGLPSVDPDPDIGEDDPPVSVQPPTVTTPQPPTPPAPPAPTNALVPDAVVKSVVEKAL